MSLLERVYRLPQNRETPIRTSRRGSIACRYAYARSTESQRMGDLGQDYLVFACSPGRVVFALCDGVAQSFFGDLGARLLGGGLVDWLHHVHASSDAAELRLQLTQCLAQLAVAATRNVRAYRLPTNLPPLLEDVLEDKRQCGTESTFVCGRLDLPSRALPCGRLLLAWLGDTRLRVWGASGECTSGLGETFHTRERWSSRLGAVGNMPHVAVMDVEDGATGITRVMAYSDGLSILDGAPMPLSNEALKDSFETASGQATSDDASFIEINILAAGRAGPR